MALLLTSRAAALVALLGASSAVAQVRLAEWSGTSGARFGQAVADAGDIDRDGRPDIAVGEPLFAQLQGRVTILSGRTGAALRVYLGDAAAKSSFGTAVGSVGDVDRDGIADLGIGMEGHGRNGILSGGIEIRSGRTGRALHTIFGDGPGDLFGTCIQGLGDINGDGHSDFAVGAPENGDPVRSYGAGYARVYSGRTGAQLFEFRGQEVTDEFGAWVAPAGDVDGDGTTDLIVTSLLENHGVGSARVYSGRTGTQLYAWFGGGNTDHFGMCATGAGDIDGDGRDDIVLGELNPFSFLKGVIWAYSGRTGQPIHKISGAPSTAMLGWRVVAVGDVDRDGHADFGATDPGDRTLGQPTGALTIWSGRTGQQLSKRYGLPGSQFGMGAGTVADLSGDGQPEVVIGLPNQSKVEVVALSDVATMGRGCSAGTSWPSLRATAPTVGNNFGTLLFNAAPRAVGVLLASSIPAQPAILSARCTLYQNSNAFPIRTLTTDGSGSNAETFLVPPQPALRGLGFALQVGLSNARSPIGFDLSNGVYMTVR